MNVIRKCINLLGTLLLIAVVALAALLVGVRLIGLTPYAVLSGSMEPTYHVGSLIYVKDIAPEDIVIGTPITFVVNEDLLLATHRVVGVEKRTTRQEQVLGADGQPVLDEAGSPVMQDVPLDEPAYYFETKGDANENADGALVHHKNVVGTPVFSIPYLGYLSSWLQTPRGMIVGGSAALVLLLFAFIPDLLDMADSGSAKRRKQSGRTRRAEEEEPPDKPAEHAPERAVPTPMDAGSASESADSGSPAPPQAAVTPEAPRRRRRRQAVGIDDEA